MNIKQTSSMYVQACTNIIINAYARGWCSHAPEFSLSQILVFRGFTGYTSMVAVEKRMRVDCGIMPVLSGSLLAHIESTCCNKKVSVWISEIV